MILMYISRDGVRELKHIMLWVLVKKKAVTHMLSPPHSD